VDLILLDPDEPLKGGHEILGKVREISSLPIIYLSSDTSVDAKVEALNAGADDYMTKPYATKELIARIHSALRRHEEPKIIVTAASPVLSMRQLKPSSSSLSCMKRLTLGSCSMINTQFLIIKFLP